MYRRHLATFALLLSAVSLASLQPEQLLQLRADERTTGYSGALSAAIVQPNEVLLHALELGSISTDGLRYRWAPVYGTQGTPTPAARHGQGFQAPAREGSWRLELITAQGAVPSELVALVMVPADRVKKGYLNGYFIGSYPAPTKHLSRAGYAPPAAFIEVTEENQDLHVSEHFQLRQFLTKGQAEVWPKYLVLDLQLVDKLEAVMQELEKMGHVATRMHVMSGYRTPAYNGPGGNGRAKFSRHTYGDASDVWVDSDGDGYMDDLNGDGRRDTGDAQVLVSAIERVEKRHPELTGGAGVYKANRAHGPFVHVDARGRAARWSKRE